MTLPRLHLPKIKKRLFWWVLAGLVAAVTLLSAARAEYNPYPAGGIASRYKSALENGQTNLSQWSTTMVIQEIPLALTRAMVGYPEVERDKTAMAPSGGLAGVFASAIGGFYTTQPVSNQQYFAYLGQKLNPVKPIYAQGKGWDFLSPILELWIISRNIAYIVFVVIFVAIGFMIMLRQKIDPQTVASVQSVLPKIIVSLILVTFSYAIFGLFVDLAFLFNGVIQRAFEGAFANFAPKACPPVGPCWIEEFYPVDFLKNVAGAGIPGILVGGIKILLGAVGIIGGDFTSFFNLAIAFTFISSVIKIFFSLLSRYVTIILITIFSPFAFLWGSLPGQQDTISSSIRTMLSAVLSFPVIMLMVNLAYIVSKTGVLFSTLPPFMGAALDKPGALCGGVGQPPCAAITLITQVISLGIIIATAKVPETIDELLKVKAGGGQAGAELAGGLRRLPIIGSFLG
ncbi:MAG: hypothetical protein ABH807_00030 [Candidatus Shapirobacteria bacterium]